MTSILWLIAHPDSSSFSHQLAERAVTQLRVRNFDVDVDDLYRVNWNPLITDADFADVAGSDLAERQLRSTVANTLATDIRTEQARLSAADLVIVQFPLWWYGMPAILKGWFDRVFTNGFAFGVEDDGGNIRRYGDGGLSGRTLLPVVTAGDREGALRDRGISGDIDDILWPLLHGTAHYTGMRAMRTHLVSELGHGTGDRLVPETSRLVERIADLDDETAIAYRALRGGDYTSVNILKPEVARHDRGFAAHIIS